MFNANVEFKVVQTEVGYEVIYGSGITRPATNEEVILWKSLEAETQHREAKIDTMIEAIAGFIENEDNFQLFEQHRGNALATVTMQNVKLRRENTELLGKVQDAVTYIRHVASTLGKINVTQVKDDVSEEVFNTITDNEVAILIDISGKANVQAEDLTMPIMERLAQVEDALQVGKRVIEHLKALVESDGNVILNT